MNMDVGKNNVSLFPFIFRLRSVVLALGESVQPPWWKTRFMNKSGLSFLERLYPKTYIRAAAYATGKAACEIHDRSVGRTGVYHLFRLPERLEIETNHLPLANEEEFITLFRLAIGDPGQLLEMLYPFCEQRETVDDVIGAQGLGTDKDLRKLETFKKVAAMYHHAFSHGKAVFPYFSSERD